MRDFLQTREDNLQIYTIFLKSYNSLVIFFLRVMSQNKNWGERK